MGSPHIGIFQCTCTFPWGESPCGNGNCSFGFPLSHAVLARNRLRNRYFCICEKQETANLHMEMVNHVCIWGFKTYGFPVPHGYNQTEMVGRKSPYENGIQNIRLPVSITRSSNGKLIPFWETILKLLPRDGQFPYGEGSVTNLTLSEIEFVTVWGLTRKSPNGIFSHMDSPFPYCNSRV